MVVCLPVRIQLHLINHSVHYMHFPQLGLRHAEQDRVTTGHCHGIHRTHMGSQRRARFLQR